MSDPVDTQLAAYNARDLDAFIACFSPDCVVEDGAGNRLMTGRDEMRVRYGTLFDNSPHLHARIAHRIRIGEYVIDEEDISGRIPDIRHAVAVYRVRQGLIDHVRFYRETT